MKIKRRQFFLLLFVINFSILFCKSNSSGPEIKKPDPPVIVPKSAENSLIEKGVDAIPETDAIFFEWFHSGEKIQAWNIYKKEGKTGHFRLLSHVSPGDTSFVDQNVTVGVRYWYFLTAGGSNGEESDPSNTITYKLIPKAGSLGNTRDVRPIFEWRSSGVAPMYYILRLYKNPKHTPVWITMVYPGFQGQRETVAYDADGSALEDSLERNGPTPGV
ncbi:MAG: hypothetical protein GXO76_07155 [Calditrichaeota bacterium]|nr:hypothetical protein [Calditrichota bacterium]